VSRGHVARGEITEEQLDRALDVLAMAWPHGHPADGQPAAGHPADG
jgi:hypothetical protein